MNENQQARKKLQDELRKLFQFDVSDLDFGIYRILNRKKDQIEQFIEKDLLDTVNEGLEAYKAGDRKKFEKQLEESRQKIPSQAFDEEGKIKPEFKDFEEVTKFLEAASALQSLSVSEDTEKKIYNDLFTFFSRYYDEGDFVTKRRISSRDSKYAVPYNGEEVLLHWANKDQYYIKTGEHFTNYKFEVDGKSVWFKVAQAEVPKDNEKESENRFFVLRPDDPIEVNGEELTIWFEYRPLTDEEEDRWRDIHNKVEKKNLKGIDREKLCIAYDDWIRSEIAGEWKEALSVNPKNKDRSILFNRLNHYTGINTADYFIHKDLQSFMERELEYYLKNEVICVDDFIKDETDQAIEVTLIRARVVRTIAQKIIAFLSQIENFQKKLFEKRKFVVDTHYCFTLDKVPEELYETILNNGAQLEKWEELYAMDKWSGELKWGGKWTKEFLKDHPFLMVDTQWFDNEFKYNLLSEIQDKNDKYLEDYFDGLLIKGENFQALNLISSKYEEALDVIYIDPPYNTVHSEILYKNQFKHSSWLSLINNTVPIGKKLLNEVSSYGFAIDDYEFPNLNSYLHDQFRNWDISTIVVNHHPQGAGGKISRTHEYYIICTRENSENLEGNYKEDYIEDRSFMRAGRAVNNFRRGRWKSFYALLYDPKKEEIVGIEDPVPLNEDYPTNDLNNLKRIYPINSKGQERVWRSSYLTGRERAENGELFVSDKGTVYQRIHHKGKREVLFSNWTDSKFNAGPHGTELLDKLGLSDEFDYPKSIYTMETGLQAQSFANSDAIILDYFAGSGTTAHAVMNLNKIDEETGNRKYIMVEMGRQFERALMPRIQKTAFSDNWKDGIPQDQDGQSHSFKYHFIESYEDALNNINFINPEDTQQAMEFEDYMLSYMLDFETQGVSATLLKEEAFKTPFDYKLNIQRGYESPKEEAVDLVETFHYLIGLWLHNLRRVKHQERHYVISIGQIRNEDAVEDVCIFWRNPEDLDFDAEAEWIQKEIIKDQIFDRIYINGVNKVKDAEQIEITFREKMFEDVV